jgi:hypothetical protein
LAKTTIDQLRRGARIHSLVFAAHVIRGADRPYDVAWEGLTYARADRSGVRGKVAFCKHGVAGLFYDPASPQAPANLKKKYDLSLHVQGMPDPLLQHVKREVLSAFDLDSGPVVTSVFWSDATGALVGARPWPKILSDGAKLVEDEMRRPAAAAAALADRYGFTPEMAAAVREAFASKAALALPAAQKITLTPEQRATLGLLLKPIVKELLDGASISLG